MTTAKSSPRRLMQEFSWPEEDLPKRMADRGSTLTAEAAAELAKEPMFCLEVRLGLPLLHLMRSFGSSMQASIPVALTNRFV